MKEALEAADKLAGEGISAEVIDVATLRPLDFATIAESVAKTGRCVIVQEAPKTAGFGAEIAARWPSFHVLGEPAYLALRGADGAALPQTFVALRDNPFHGADERPAAVLAALCEIYPDGRGSGLADTILRIAGRKDADGDGPVE
ncbi:transketolase C-terminal domain-containing protein, partial [Raoultella sp. 18084]|uniref:transketolase C-terminal domain-containing protein n=1 Tax=Raoultella sp. 18084 TaxID=2681416 RepID=UPI00272BF41E